MEQEAALYHTNFSATPAYSVRRKKTRSYILWAKLQIILMKITIK